MSINNGTMNRIGAGGTLNTFGSVQSVDNTKIQELTEAIDSATESIQEGKSAIDNTVQTGLDTISASGQIVLQTINNTATTVTDTLNNTAQEAVQTVSDEVDNAKQEISTAATTVVQYDVPVICPKEDVGCVLIKNADLGETETIEVHRPTGESVHYTGKPIDFSQFVNVGIVSDEYNPNKPYTVGEYCIYLKERYKCIANTTAGILPTNTTYFVKAKIDDEFSELNSKVPFKFAIDSDGNYGYIKDGADTVTPFKSGGGANWVTHLLDSNNGVYKQGNYVYCMKLIFPNDTYFSNYPYRSISTMFSVTTKNYYCYNPVSYSDYTEGDVTWISDPKYIDLYFPGLAGLPKIYHTWWQGIDTQSTKSMLAVMAKGSSVEGGGYAFTTGGLYGGGSTFKMKVEDAALSSTEVTIPANSSINVTVPSLKNIWVYATSSNQAAGLINIREGSFVVNALRTCTNTYANTAVTVVTCTAMTPTSITLTSTKSAAINATVVYQTD